MYLAIFFWFTLPAIIVKGNGSFPVYLPFPYNLGVF
jgi:hypothetical protein